tara:strand:+ start:1247 stop:2158 length:912 start_codon:yes stop_codon:yes gene_type:complete
MKINKAIKKMNPHVIFLSELLLTNFGNLLVPNHRKKITNPIVRYVKYPLGDIKRYLKRNFIIQNKRRKEIRNLILKYCTRPNRNIRFIVNYAIDISRISNKKNNVAFCFGIYDDIAFEQSLAKNFDFDIHCFDPTPKSIDYMKKLDNKFNLKFYPKALWTRDCKKKFFFLESDTTSEDMSGSLLENHADGEDFLEVECCTLDTFKKQLAVANVDLLKMDIEGAAFEVLVNLNDESPNSLPEQITTEIEIPLYDEKKMGKENNFESFIERLNIFFDSISQNYTIYYVPRTKRYNHLELLMVKDI